MPAAYDQGTTLAFFELGVKPADVAGARAALRISHRQLSARSADLVAGCRRIRSSACPGHRNLINAAPNDRRGSGRRYARKPADAWLCLVEDIPGVIADLAKKGGMIDQPNDRAAYYGFLIELLAEAGLQLEG